MTNISTIYDAYVSICETALPTYAKIPNAYEVNSNAELFLKFGFAVGYGGSTNSKRLLGCQMSELRDFSVILVAQITAAITDFSGFNLVAKNLFEDRFKIIKAIEKDPTLTTSQTTTQWVNDGGLEFLQAGQAKYFLIETVFQSEYFENLNT